MRLFFCCAFLLGAISCTHALKKSSLTDLWPHGEIHGVAENVFMVTGSNIIVHEGTRLQTSRNMIIVRQGRDLSLINSVRLDEVGLRSLQALGVIKNVIRIGAFHGRDDAFYQNRFGAKIWAFHGMEFSHGERLDFELSTDGLPIKNAVLFKFESTRLPEALIVLPQDGGILISCDAIKNWVEQDRFFDDQTFGLMKDAGAIGEANIDNTWLSAMQPSHDELKKILKLDFKSLLSAHGPALMHVAKDAVTSSVKKIESK